jgi:exonuclease III
MIRCELRLGTIAVLLTFIGPHNEAISAEKLRVMSFNIWVGGESGGQPLAQTVNAIEAARADIVGIQESHGEERDGKSQNAAQSIAEKLSWHYFDQGDEDTGIISRYPIVAHTPKKWGAAVELPSGRRVWLFNAHFNHAPYQPYQLLRIPYHDARFITTEREAIEDARRARAREVVRMLEEIASVRGEGGPIFVTGDFNEPSVLDWTDAVAKAGRCPVAVRWPATELLQQARFVDTYRAAHPDPLAAPGYTWTPTTSENDARDRHDRIDFVFASKSNVKIVDCEVVGEKAVRADIVVRPYPSDHRAVVATVELE